MLRKLQLDALKADLSVVESMLAARTRDDDPIGHFQFNRRKTRLEQEIEALEGSDDHHAELGIFFGGGPVQGSRGINADFAGKALEDIQALISKHFVGKQFGPLKKTGQVPMNDQSQMLVTDVVRGSFGFILAEAGDTAELVGTPLKDAVDEVSDILSRVGVEDEAVFDEAVSQMDERILVTLKKFLERLDEQGATMRVVHGQRDFLLNRDAVSLARRRVRELEITEQLVEYSGTLFLLPDSKRFDLLLGENEESAVIKGPVSNAVLKQLQGQQELGEDPIDIRMISTKTWSVEVKRREIRERQRAPRFVYTLSRLKGPA